MINPVSRRKWATPGAISLLVGTLVASGCILGGPFPKSWGPLYRGDDLEARLAGRYDCSGELVIPESQYSEYIDLGYFLRGAGCDFVLIETSQEGLLRLTFHFPERSATKVREFSRGEGYKTSAKWILLENLADFQTGGIVAAWTSEKAALAVNERGDLIVRRVNTDVGLIWIIPAGGKSTWWGKFPRLPMAVTDPR